MNKAHLNKRMAEIMGFQWTQSTDALTDTNATLVCQVVDTLIVGRPYKVINEQQQGKYAHAWSLWNPVEDYAQALQVLEKCGQRLVNGTQFVCLAFSPSGVSAISDTGHWNVGRIKVGAWDGLIGSDRSITAAICQYAHYLFPEQS